MSWRISRISTQRVVAPQSYWATKINERITTISGKQFAIKSPNQPSSNFNDDENYTFVSAWEYKGEDLEPELHKEDLNYKEVTPTQRSYK